MGTEEHPGAEIRNGILVLRPARYIDESETVEFKSSLFHSYKPEIPEKVITGSVIKTVAAFLNTNGGTLAIGMADDGTVLGLTA